MKVRRAIIKDLKRVQDLYGIVSDEMAGTIYDIMWRRDIYPSKKEIVKDIRHHELYVLEKDNMMNAITSYHGKYLRMMMKS